VARFLWLLHHKRFLSRADLDEGWAIVKVIPARNSSLLKVSREGREGSEGRIWFPVSSHPSRPSRDRLSDSNPKRIDYLLPRRTGMRGRTVGGNGSFGGALGAGGAGAGGGWCSNCPIVAARKSSLFVTVSPIFVSGNFISPI
jgi:hypothetical protein